ncbi:MAG: DUF86 domain-containing protein [Dehalococcoidia bacterium]|nr:DUF86 domain-containing protein [Dehalococcoidia bacterium]
MKCVRDIAGACEQITAFTAGRTFPQYEDDAMLRSAVERQFEIIGEPLLHLSRLNPAAANRITEYRRIIAFRNILAHGYAQVDDRLVWDIVETKLPTLREEVASPLAGTD